MLKFTWPSFLCFSQLWMLIKKFSQCQNWFGWKKEVSQSIFHSVKCHVWVVRSGIVIRKYQRSPSDHSSPFIISRSQYDILNIWVPGQHSKHSPAQYLSISLPSAKANDFNLVEFRFNPILNPTQAQVYCICQLLPCSKGRWLVEADSSDKFHPFYNCCFGVTDKAFVAVNSGIIKDDKQTDPPLPAPAKCEIKLLVQQRKAVKNFRIILWQFVSNLPKLVFTFPLCWRVFV